MNDVNELLILYVILYIYHAHIYTSKDEAMKLFLELKIIHLFLYCNKAILDRAYIISFVRVRVCRKALGFSLPRWGFTVSSFLEALYGTSSSSFSDLRTSTFCGLSSLWIFDQEIKVLVTPFQFALLGFFPIKRPFLDSICNFFFCDASRI